MADKKPGLKRQIHPMPDYVKRAIEERGLMDDYKQRPAYQQNDYIGWINQAILKKTKEKRLNQMLDELESGGIYMKMSHSPSKKHEKERGNEQTS